MLIEYFLGVYFDNQNFNDDNTEKQHIRRNILFSMFSTINSKTNQYIDLLTGQRYTFLSKKDINTLSCKVFYEKKITNLQDFLIALKIALIRYQECCNEQLELIVYRISVEEEDIRLVSEVEQKQAQRKLKFSTGNVVICNLENKYTQHFIKNIESLLSNGGDNSKVSDHGQLFGYLQSYLKNGKLSLIKHVINQGSSIISQLPEIEFLTKSMMPLKSTYKCNSIKLTLNLFIKQLQINQANPSTKSPQLSINFYKPSFKLPSSFLFNKQSFGLFSKIVVHYKSFVQITKSKLQSIITLYNYIYYTITQFYEQQRFPISLQIKKAQDTNWMLKLYYISKIYSLSEKYQMENLEPVMEKIKTIKQQIIISLKSLYTDINLLDKDNEIEKNPSSYDIYASSKSTIRANSIHNNDNPFNKQEIIVKIFKPELDKIKKYLKYILNFNFRLITHEYDEKLQLTQNCNKQRPNKYLQEAVLFTKKTNLNNINLDNLLNINFVSFLEDVLKARQQNSSSPSNKQANTSISKLSNHSSLHTNLRDSSFNHDTSRNKNSEHQSYFLRPIQNLIKDQETIKSFEKVDYSLPRLNYNKKNKAALLNEKCLNSEVNLNKSLIKQHSQNGIKNYPHSLKKSLNSYHESINQKQNQKAVDSLNKILKKSIKIHLNNIKKDPQSIGDKVVKSTHSYSNDKSSFVDQKIEKYNFSIINISNDKELSLAIQKSFQQKRIRKEKRGEKISHSIGDTLLDKSQVRYIKRHKIIRNKVQQIKLPEIEIKKIC